MGVPSLVVAVGLLMPTQAPSSPQGDEGDETAIRAVLRRAGDAWGRGQGEAYAAAFHEDADYVTFGGERLKGRRAIASLHQRLFDTALRGSRLELRIEGLRFLRHDVALVHAAGGILEAGQTEVSDDRNSMQTVVLTKRDGAWLIAASQVTRVRPMGLRGAQAPDR